MKITLLGVNIDAVGRWEAMRILSRRLAAGRQSAVYTPNPIMVWQARKDGAFRAALNRGDLAVADGVGITLGARLAGLSPPPRIAGIELGEDVLNYAARAGLRVFFLGGKEGVARRAAEQLRKRLPALMVCGVHHGYFSKRETDAIIEKIKRARADVVIVCLGSPRQEFWIDQNRRALGGVRLFMGLGGALDVWAGDLRRAPRAVSKMGLEWAWRMARQPRRLRGLAPISSFFCATLRERGKKRKKI